MTSSGEPEPTTGPVKRGADGVALSSSVVVDQMAFSNNNGIPLAAMVDFVPPASLQLPQITRQPQRCRACAAYMNAYCKTNIQKGLWRCSFCGQANTAQDVLTQANVLDACPELQQEAVEYVFPAPPPQGNRRSAHIVLAVDATPDEAMLQGLRSALLEWLPTLDPATRISLISFDSVVSLHHLGLPDQDGTAPCTGPSGSFSLTLPGSRPLNPTLLSSHLTGASLGPGGQRAQLSVAVGAGLEVLRSALHAIRPLEADVPVSLRPRCLGLAVEAALRLLAAEASETSATSSTGAPGSGQDSDPASNPARVARGSRVMVLTAGPCNRGPGGVAVTALEAGAGYSAKALGLSKEEQQQVAAADKYVAQLAEYAACRGAVVDIVLGSDQTVHAPLLSNLAKETGGLLLLHRGFGPCLGAALKASLAKCFGSSAVLDCYVSEGLRLAQWLGPVEVLQAPHPDDIGLAMAQDRRLSSGACSVARLQEGRGAALKLEVVRNLEDAALLVQVVLQFVDASIGGRLVQRVVTRRLPVVKSLQEYLDGVNAEVAAVVLAKKAVLDARKLGAVWSAAKAEELRYALRAQLALIASRCGPQVQLSVGMLGFGAKRVRRIPDALLPLAQALYQLQRPSGPLLGPAAPPNPSKGDLRGSKPDTATTPLPLDKRFLRMNTLLSSGLRASQLLVLPQLYRWLEGQAAVGKPPELHELPPADIAVTSVLQQLQRLQQEVAMPGQGKPAGGRFGAGAHLLLLHAGSTITAVLPGSATARNSSSGGGSGSTEGPSPTALPAASLEALRTQALTLGAGTWPAPELLLLQSDGSRYVQDIATSGSKVVAGGTSAGGAAPADEGLDALCGRLLPLADAKQAEVSVLFHELLDVYLGLEQQGKAGQGKAGPREQTFAQWCQAGGVQVGPQWVA